MKLNHKIGYCCLLGLRGPSSFRMIGATSILSGNGSLLSTDLSSSTGMILGRDSSKSLCLAESSSLSAYYCYFSLSRDCAELLSSAVPDSLLSADLSAFSSSSLSTSVLRARRALQWRHRAIKPKITATAAASMRKKIQKVIAHGGGYKKSSMKDSGTSKLAARSYSV